MKEIPPNAKLKDLIDCFFEKEMILEILTSYDLYYQISLGNYVYTTTLDTVESINKLQELNLHINPGLVFTTTFNILELIAVEKNDIKKSFFTNLKARSMFHSLYDFLNNDKEIIDPRPFRDMISEQIANDTFFNEEMKKQFDRAYDDTFFHWSRMISSKAAKEIKNLMMDLMANYYV